MIDPKNNNAVTATYDNVSIWLADWIAHHKRYFKHMFIWVDDPEELELAKSFEEERVSVNLGNQLSHESNSAQAMFRAEQNTTSAIELATKRGFDWLLHIDSDELFVCNNPNIWNNPMAGLQIFANHECCPVWSADSPLTQVKNFKINGKMDFLLYGNGKSAVRCHEGVAANGPHLFKSYPGEKIAQPYGFILHFACCTFDIWFKKYNKLGAFSNFWWDDPDMPITFDFHKASRDTIMKYRESGDIGICHDFFKSIIIPDHEIDKLVDEGQVMRWLAQS